MNISIKSKLYAGIGLLAGFVVLLWISGSIFINTLAENSGAIVQDNIRSVSYAQQMEQALNDLYTAQVTAIGTSNPVHILEGDTYRQTVQRFESILAQQEGNITETGEQELAGQLRANYRDLLNIFQTAVNTTSLTIETIEQRLTPAYHRLQQNLSQLTNTNVDAIHRKNSIAQQTASNVTFYMSLIGALCSILGIAMLVRFPGYIVNPIQTLIQRIKEIANRNYDHTLEFNTGDEYQELADAFNQMARKLQEYENSSLDRIMSEKKRMEAIINHMGDAVIGLDAGHNILFVNYKAIELIGREKEELVGRYAPDIASVNELFHKVLRTLTPGRSDEDEDEPNYIKAGGENEHFYSVEKIPVRHIRDGDTGGKSPLGYIILLKNVTRFREQDQAKTNFISVMSHELKTPISSINMSLRLLEDKRIGTLNGEQKDLVYSIRKDLSRMKRTTSELLDLSKIETGNIQLDTGDALPGDLLEYAFETMVMQATQHDLEIDLRIAEDLPMVRADSRKTVWVLVNLISNAIRYTGAGGHITLEAQMDKDPGFVRFSVEDTGEGIEPEYLDKIFDKYFQVDKNQKDRSGSGLGLSIAKEFITAQGGRIWAESKPGRGSQFYFTLPATDYIKR